MSDTENTVDSSEVTPEQAAEIVTKEQKLAMVKGNLLNSLNANHNNLFNFVSTLPINEDQKKFALANLIQSLHWVEDGIEALHFEVVEVPKMELQDAAEDTN